MPDRLLPAPRRVHLRFWGLVTSGVSAAALLLVAIVAEPAAAQTQIAPLNAIITRLQQVITGLLVGLATLFLTVGGVRYLFAGGDPSQIEKAKVTLRSAVVGYGIAALAGVLFSLLKYIVGT